LVRKLWRREGQGDSASPNGPFKVGLGITIHKPDDKADRCYRKACIWSRTIPLENAIFRDDILPEAIHEDNADKEYIHPAKIVRTVSD
jgi:hypothetical protein